jgi:beta-lactamase regulating signal transducer with metallopeptidase domain
MPPQAFETLYALASRPLTLCLLHGVWVGFLTFGVIGLWSRGRRPWRATHQYWLLFLSLLLTALAPGFIVAWQRVSVLPAHSERTPIQNTIKVVAGDLLGTTEARTHRKPTSIATSKSHVRNEWLIAARCWVAGRLEIAEPWLVGLWMLGTTALIVRLGVAFAAAHALRRGSQPAPRPLAALARRVARRMKLRKVPRIYIHDRLGAPCLLGLWQPLVLIPQRLIEVTSPQMLEAILAHELGHARRRDLIANLAQRAVEVAYSLNPAVHLISNALRRQREICTDALATSVTNNPLALAQVLELLARDRFARSNAGSLVTSMSAESSVLLPRIQEIFGMTPQRKRGRVWSLVLVSCAALVAFAATTMGWPQDAPKPRVKPKVVARPSQDGANRNRVDMPENKPIVQQPGTPLPTRTREVIQSEVAGSPYDPRLFRVGVEKSAVTERQLSYKVEFLDIDLAKWRIALAETLEPTQQDAKFVSWKLDAETARRLQEITSGDALGHTIQAPKVTAYENSAVSFVNTHKLAYVAAVKPIVTQTTLRFEPTVKELELGVTLSVRGELLAGGVRLRTTIQDKAVISMQEFGVPGSIVDAEGRTQTVTAPVHLPAWREITDELTITLKPGTSLLVSLGFYEQRDKPSDAADAAIGIVSVLGGPKLEPAHSVRERLLLITPRVILNEAEEVSAE